MTERNVNCSTSTYIHPTSLYIVSKAFLVIGKDHVVYEVGNVRVLDY